MFEIKSVSRNLSLKFMALGLWSTHKLSEHKLNNTVWCDIIIIIYHKL